MKILKCHLLALFMLYYSYCNCSSTVNLYFAIKCNIMCSIKQNIHEYYYLHIHRIYTHMTMTMTMK